jgi:hypothetical protein
MLKRIAALLAVLALSAVLISAQGLNTMASKDDWEEINFEFNSSVLVDGFPSLLRLAELLQKNPGFKVKLEGHTDNLGSSQLNDKLGLARANMVRDFLVKYGARPSQIDAGTRGKVDPKYPGQKPTFTKTDDARWMNRRVVITVTDDQGRTVSAAGVGDAIRAIEPPKQVAAMTDCCSEVLKRLDKLDDIARLLRDLNDQNAQLRKDLDALKQQQQVLESKANQPAPPPAPSASEVAKAVESELDKNKTPKFQLLGVNLGMDQGGNLTATGKGRFFGVFEDHYAIQAEAEYMYFRGQQEGQFDLGLVDRIGRFQGGLFYSFKHVSLAGNQNGGTLGQAAVSLDYLFKWGKLGVFGTYGFMNNALINSVAAVLPNGITSPDLLEQRYLRVVNQAGASVTVGLWGRNYLEGNLGYLKSAAYGDRAGGTLRFIFPLNNRIALTVEGDLNPTILGPYNDGRAVVGVIFGNALRPKEFLANTTPVPVDVPRVRYEVVNRLVRTGHTPPVADAGPNQIGVQPGPITLNGSGSYSPDGLPITYQWTQQGGPTVTLSSPTSAITSFPSVASTTYVFQLVVTDSLGGKGTARVMVTTASGNKLQIQFFIANPPTIQAGQSSTLSWSVTNSTSVTLNGVSVQAVGSSSVAPTATTTYTLTATNAGTNTTVTATQTVVVNGSNTKVVYCYASPSNIVSGESSTLSYQTTNATSVAITPGIGSVALSGSQVVTPTTSTTYTVTATGANGTTDSCSASVQVTTGQVPQIIRFSAIPATITAGGSSTLLWSVQNATTVSINNGVGTSVSLGGSQPVSPTTTTTYTLTATNAAGSVTSQATVTVNPAVTITSFTASPNPSPSPGTAVNLSCVAANATSLTMNGLSYSGSSATATVAPQATTAYTCIASGSSGQTVQQSLTVTVNGTSTGTGGGTTPPTIVIKGGNTINTNFRFITLDASGSFSPQGNNPLQFVWVSLNDKAFITNANSATPSVTLGLTSGVYLFQLTVIDSKGNQATAIVTVNFTI